MEIATKGNKMKGSGRQRRKFKDLSIRKHEDNEKKYEKREDRVRGLKYYTDIWKKGRKEKKKF